MTRSYFVRTYGCQMNEHDSERLAGLLEADGLVSATSAEDADVLVLNTCCIRENADNKLYGALGHLKAAKAERPGLEIVVAGCLAQKDGDDLLARAPHVDVVLGTHNVHRAVELLHRARTDGPVAEIWDETDTDDPGAFPSALPAARDVPYAAWVTIQIGCDNSCAFCIVPAVRGPEISRPFDEVVEEVGRLAADGVVEVTLLGQNVNSFGRDGARRPRPRFAELLRAVGAVEGIERVRFTSPHPKDLRPETLEAMADVDEVCPHLHLPLQAGSDRTLRAMQRGYTAERYLEKLRGARRAVEGLAVSTDVIVGFPGETEADFEQTLEVVADAEFDSAFTFVYSPRPGTAAAGRVDEFVPPEVAADRMERLRRVVERSALRRNEARVGERVVVLVEGPSKRDPSRTTGRTPHNGLVHFQADEPVREGSFASVDVTGAGKHHLMGDYVETVTQARHRARIPVVAAP